MAKNGDLLKRSLKRAFFGAVVEDGKSLRLTFRLLNLHLKQILMIEHRVYFRLKPEVTDEQFRDIYGSILILKDEIPGIVSVDFKKNVSSEGKDRGCKDFFVMMFKNTRYLQDYLGNPRHKSVAVEHFRPYVDEVLVFDNEI